MVHWYNGKSEAEVINKKRLHLRYCTVKANYREARSIARPLCDSTATCTNTRWYSWNM